MTLHGIKYTQHPVRAVPPLHYLPPPPRVIGVRFRGQYMYRIGWDITKYEVNILDDNVRRHQSVNKLYSFHSVT